MEGAPEIPEDVMRAILENSKAISQIDYSLLQKQVFENFKIIKRAINNLPLREYQEQIKSIIASNGLLDKCILNKEFLNAKYYEQISNIYPELYISNSENSKNIVLSDSLSQNSKIPLKNVKDAVLLNNLIEDLTFAECADFINHLSLHPMLGYKNSLGQKIYRYIEKCPREKLIDKVCYRIRVSTNQKQIPYTESEMFEPPYTYPGQNRFSMVGQNPLYLCEKLDIALSEADVDDSSKYTWMKVKISNVFEMLNITNTEIPLFKSCHRRTEDGSRSMYTEYLVPNYISDCAKHIGFDGITYSSVYDYSCKNFVLYKAGKRDFIVEDIKGNNYEKS